MDSLRDIVQREVRWYAASGHNVRSFMLCNEEEQVYGVVVIDSPIRYDPAGVAVLARLEDDFVIIEEDLTDKPLLEALLQQGIPREKIICAYRGETLPEPAAL